MGDAGFQRGSPASHLTTALNYARKIPDNIKFADVAEQIPNFSI